MDGALDPRHTLGRIFGDDWTIANVAKLLRFNAGQGVLRPGFVSSSLQEVNQDYLRKTAARHLPSGVTVTFRRDQAGSLHAELCFADLNQYLPWSEAVAEQWLEALFPGERMRLVESSTGASEPGVIRRFTLPA
jgi:hypothetical protein